MKKIISKLLRIALAIIIVVIALDVATYGSDAGVSAIGGLMCMAISFALDILAVLIVIIK